MGLESTCGTRFERSMFCQIIPPVEPLSDRTSIDSNMPSSRKTAGANSTPSGHESGHLFIEPTDGGGFIPPHGGYQELLSFRKAEIVYDATVQFCTRFLSKRDRTYDQMVQAARSGKQNIVEGSQISGTSKELEIKLMNVARASLEELLTDYRDFLRTRNLPLWDKHSKEALYVRRLGSRSDVSYGVYRSFIETRTSDVVANIVICLVCQTTFLLDRQIKKLEQLFLKEGGMRERMARARLAAREEQRKKERGGSR